MKKLVFAAVAAIALTASVSFVACNKPVAPATDSIANDTTAIEEVVESIDSLADSVAAVVDSIAE
ncbi:MAG: hypothetical protein IKP41_09060 [Bacteroidaceae bacterium]|nr:hypothetical protein [Bacteroidaceae bacterium]